MAVLALDGAVPRPASGSGAASRIRVSTRYWCAEKPSTRLGEQHCARSGTAAEEGDWASPHTEAPPGYTVPARVIVLTLPTRRAARAFIQRASDMTTTSTVLDEVADGLNDLLIKCPCEDAQCAQCLRIYALYAKLDAVRFTADGKGATGVGDQHSLPTTSGPDTAPNPDRKSPRRLTS